MKDQQTITRSAGVISCATLLSRFFGLLRDIVTANAFGTGMAMDAFVVAFTIPNLFRGLLGEGALSAGFVPVYTEYLEKKGKEESWRLVNVALTLLLVVLAAVVIAGLMMIYILRLTVEAGGKKALILELFQVMFPYLFFMCLFGLAMGILNSLRHFALPALSPVVMNLVWIASVIFLCPLFGVEPERRIFGLAWGVTLSGAVQLGIQIPWLWKKGWRFRFILDWHYPGVRKVMTLMAPATLGMAIVQFNVMVDRLLAMAIGKGAPSALYYANRLVQFPLGVFGIALATAALPVMASQVARDKIDDFIGTFSYALRTVFLIALPASVGLLVLRQPIVNLIFQRGEFGSESARATAWVVMFYALGLFSFTGLKIVNQAFYSIQDTKTPVKVGFGTVLLNVVLNLLVVFHPWLREHLWAGGLALTTSLCALINILVLLCLLRRRLGTIRGGEIALSFLKIAFASAIMGLFCQFSLRYFPAQDFPGGGLRKLIPVAGPMVSGMVIFVALTFLLRIRELRQLGQAFRIFPAKNPNSD